MNLNKKSFTDRSHVWAYEHGTHISVTSDIFPLPILRMGKWMSMMSAQWGMYFLGKHLSYRPRHGSWTSHNNHNIFLGKHLLHRSIHGSQYHSQWFVFLGYYSTQVKKLGQSRIEFIPEYMIILINHCVIILINYYVIILINHIIIIYFHTKLIKLATRLSFIIHTVRELL